MAQIWFAVADKKKQLPKKRLKRGQKVVTVGDGGLAEFMELKARHEHEIRMEEEAKAPQLSAEEAGKRTTAVMTDLSLGGDGKINFDNPKWERGFWKSVRSRRRARGK